MLKVILTGGGTAGHINPALAIGAIIKESFPDAKFLYVGTEKGMESRLVPKAGYDFETINVRGFQRKITVKNIARNVKAVSILAAANAKSKKIIKAFQPDIVIGTGGYVSEPVVSVACSLGVKTAIHEQNAFPGITTKLLARKVDAVMLNTSEAKRYLKTDREFFEVGLPVRKDFGKMTKAEARAELNIPDDEFVILSTGGSLGAGKVNENIAGVMEYEVENNLEITHIHSFGGMGKDSFLKDLTEKGVDYENNDRIRAFEYIHNMSVCMAAADLVISRSGASALAEIEAMGKASILIPSPNVTGNHQFHNANVLGKEGAAIVIEEKNLSVGSLVECILDLYSDREKLKRFSDRAYDMYIKNTDEKILNVITKLI